MCCAVNGTNINATIISMEQRTWLDEHIWFVKSDHIKRSEILTSSNPMFCLNVNGIHTYIRKKVYICMAQISINGRKQTINRTTYIEKNNVEGSILLIWNVLLQFNYIKTSRNKCFYVYTQRIFIQKNHFPQLGYLLYFITKSMIKKNSSPNKSAQTQKQTR